MNKTKRMKKIIHLIGITAISCAFALLTGCANVNGLVKALATDPAAYHLQVNSIYVTITLDRANPGTNQMTVGNNGISTKP